MKKYSLKDLIITGIICSVIFSGIGVAAVTLNADKIKYTPISEKYTATNAQEALDEIYNLAENSKVKRIVVASDVDGYGAKSFDVTSMIPEYASLTADNFALVVTGSYEKIDDYSVGSPGISYDPSTGVVTIGGIHGMGRNNQGRGGNRVFIYTVLCFY